MKSLPGLILVLILLFSGCSGETIQVEEDEVIGEMSQDQLTIFNSSDQSIYYAIFDQSILPFILWAPISSDENKISGFHKKSFRITDILREGQTTGTIVFYFWTGENPESGAINFLTFEISE